MSFQLSILKILAGQPGGRASLEIVKQHLAIFYTSGPEWPARMKRIASREPNLDIFGQRLIEREEGYWIITAHGRKILERLEVLDAAEKLNESVTKGQPRDRPRGQLGDERLPLPAAPPRPIAWRKRAWRTCR